MFKFVEQGSTSCHENRKSIQRKSRERLLTRTIDLERRWPDSLCAQGAPGTGINAGRRGGVGVIYDGLQGESLQYSQTLCATETEKGFNYSKYTSQSPMYSSRSPVLE